MTNLSKLTKTLAAAFMACVAWGCSRTEGIPGEFHTIPDAKWEYGRVLTFNSRGDTLPGVIDRIAVSVRHTNDYPYANLWLELAYSASDSLVADTFNVRLADEYGKWYGSGSGPVILHTDTIRPSRTPDPGTTFDLRHIMRVETLTDIEQIGLTFVTKTSENNF